MLHFTFFERDVPDESLVTGVAVVPFVGRECVLADVRHRPGHEFPAGHREPGETAEQTAARELMEETGATAEEMHRVGYVRCHNDDKPIEGYPFPDSYLVVFAARCSDDGIGKGLHHETRGVLVCPPEEVARNLGFNRSLYLEMLAAARKRLGI